MNEMRVASIAFAAYFVSSAEGGSITRMGLPVRTKGSYSLRMTASTVRVVGPDHDAVRLEEVVDGRPFLQELGVRDDRERVLRERRHHVPDPGRRPHRHRGLVDEDLVAVHRAGDAPRDVEHVGEVRRAVLVLRCPHRDEDHLARPHDFVEVRGEAQSFLGDVARDHLVEAGLVDRDLALPQPVDLRARRCPRTRRSCRSRRGTPPPPARRTRYRRRLCTRRRPSLTPNRARVARKALLLSFASRWTSVSTCAPPSPGRPGSGRTCSAWPSGCPVSLPTTGSTSSRPRSRSAIRRAPGPRTSASWTAACPCAG